MVERPEKRRDERHAIRLPVDLLRGKERETLLSEDVSFRGIFLRTDTPLALRQLLRIEMVLPPEDKRITLHAKVIWIAKPAEGVAAPGMGLEFLALEGDLKAEWHAFIRHVQPARKESRERMQVARSAGLPDRVRRRFVRHKTELRLLVERTGDLETLLATDVSQGGMFVSTMLALPIGHSFVVTVMHPESGVTFPLDCIVRRRQPEANPPGVGVEFERMTPERRRAFLEFIADDLPVLSVAEEEVGEDQVEQWEEEEPTNVKIKR